MQVSAEQDRSTVNSILCGSLTFPAEGCQGQKRSEWPCARTPRAFPSVRPGHPAVQFAGATAGLSSSAFIDGLERPSYKRHPLRGPIVSQSWTITKHHLLALLFALTTISFSPRVFATDPDQELLEGLRSRQLFELAEAYCQRGLARQPLAAEKSSQLTIELIRIYSEWAINSPPEQRTEYWDRARQVAADFETRHGAHPRIVLVRVQDALTHLAHGELARMEGRGGHVARTSFGYRPTNDSASNSSLGVNRRRTHSDDSTPSPRACNRGRP